MLIMQERATPDQGLNQDIGVTFDHRYVRPEIVRPLMTLCPRTGEFWSYELPEDVELPRDDKRPSEEVMHVASLMSGAGLDIGGIAIGRVGGEGEAAQLMREGLSDGERTWAAVAIGGYVLANTGKGEIKMPPGSGIIVPLTQTVQFGVSGHRTPAGLFIAA